MRPYSRVKLCAEFAKVNSVKRYNKNNFFGKKYAIGLLYFSKKNSKIYRANTDIKVYKRIEKRVVNKDIQLGMSS